MFFNYICNYIDIYGALKGHGGGKKINEMGRQIIMLMSQYKSTASSDLVK